MKTVKAKEVKVAEFTMNDIIPIVSILGVAGIYASYMLKIQSDTRATLTENSVEYNASTDAITGTTKVTGQFPTLGLISGAVIIIGMLYMLFQNRK